MTKLKESELSLIISQIELVAFDFDGVFTDNTVLISETGIESVNCWRSDGIGIKRLIEKKIKIYIISSEINQVVSTRAKKLNIPCLQGVKNKKKAIINVCSDLNICMKRTAFVGNDLNDIPALQIVGIPICVGDAYPEIIPYTIYQTEKNGGRGAVREVCDLIYVSKINQKKHELKLQNH